MGKLDPIENKTRQSNHTCASCTESEVVNKCHGSMGLHDCPEECCDWLMAPLMTVWWIQTECGL